MTKKRTKQAEAAPSPEADIIQAAESAPTGAVAGAGAMPLPAAAPPTGRPGVGPGSLTVADAALLLIVALAAVLRFAWLGTAQPLSPAEAEAALPVWAAWHGGGGSFPTVSPAYFSLTALLIPILGDSDWVVRMVPALFGIATVFLLWYLRRQWQPPGLLAAALLLALSPLALVTARTAGGDAIALFALMLLFVAALRLSAEDDDVRRRRWTIALGAGLGLGLASSPLFYTGLLPLSLLWWWFAGIEDGAGESEPNDAPWPFARLWPHLRPIGLAALVTFVSLATTLLLHPIGLGGAIGLLPAWLGQFGLPTTGNAAAASPLLAGMRYEPALFVLGFPIIIWAMWRRPALGLMLSFWLVSIPLIMFIQPGIVNNAAALVVPGYLLVGLAAGQIATLPSGSRQTAFTVAGGTLLLLGALVISLGRYARVAFGADQSAYLLLAGLLAIAAIVLVTLMLMSDERAALSGAFLGVAGLLLLLQWGTGWQLATLGANDPRERWVTEGTDDEMRLLTATLREVSLQAANSEYDIDIFSAIDAPVLRWYLRDYRFAQFGAAAPVDGNYSVVITPVSSELQLPSDYIGDDFGWMLRENEMPTPLNVAELLRWWLFRDGAAAGTGERLILWLRADLAPGR